MIGILEHLPVLIIVISLISAIIIPVAGRFKIIYSWYITVATTFISLIISITLLNRVLDEGKISYWLGGWQPPWGIEYVIDYLNVFILLIVSFIAFMVSLYSRLSVEKEIAEDKIVPFYSVYMIFITGLMGMTLTGDLFNLFVFIEISSLAAYTLISVGKKRDALMASYNYLILGTIAATFILLGIGYLYMVTGTLNMADLRELLPPLYESKVVLTAFAFFTVGLSLKLALFPLHVWLPNAYTHAPSVVSAIMAATSTKVGAYVLLRIMFTVFKVEFNLEVVPVTKILLVLSSMAILAGSILAISQTNIKRMLAYSSVGQIGYIVLGAALINQAGMTGSIIHIFNHAIMKGTLFLAIGAIIYRLNIEDISGFRGLGKKMPFTMAAFTIAALSMIGIPLTVGFVSKWYIGMGALNAGMWYLIPVILLSSLLTAVYFWRIIESIYFKGTETEEDADEKLIMEVEGSTFNKSIIHTQGDAPLSMLIPTLILAGMCLFFGVAAFLPVSLADKAAKMLLGGM